MGKIEPATANDVGLNLPVNPFRCGNAVGKPLSAHNVGHFKHSFWSEPSYSPHGLEIARPPFAPACKLAWKVADKSWLVDDRGERADLAGLGQSSARRSRCWKLGSSAASRSSATARPRPCRHPARRGRSLPISL